MPVLEIIQPKFDVAKTAAQHEFNKQVQNTLDFVSVPWYELEGGGIKGAKAFRKFSAEGRGGVLPKPVLLDRAETVSVPSSNSNPNLFLRVIKPTKKPSRGVYLHIHGGKRH